MDVQNPIPRQEFGEYAPPAVKLGKPSEWFASGNFCGSAASIVDWQSAAASGLIGNAPPAIGVLEKLDSPEACFYLGAALWIDGKEQEAIDVLAHSNEPAAARLHVFSGSRQ